MAYGTQARKGVLKISLIDGKISYDDFIREYNNADNYHPEHWLENISHKHEEK